MAMRSSSDRTSLGLRRWRPCGAQLALAPLDRVVEPPPPSAPVLNDCPLLVPPEFTTIVDSPSRPDTYSAVGWSLTPKNTWLVFDSSVCSCPSGKHFESWPSDW